MSDFYSVGEKVFVTYPETGTPRKATVLQMGCGEVLVEYIPMEKRRPYKEWVPLDQVCCPRAI